MTKCPHCDFEYAYVGFLRVDCVNTECKFYSATYCDRVIAELEAEHEKNRIDRELKKFLGYEGENLD